MHNTPFLCGATLPSGPSFFRADFTNGLPVCKRGPRYYFGSRLREKVCDTVWIFESDSSRFMQKLRDPAGSIKVVSFHRLFL